MTQCSFSATCGACGPSVDDPGNVTFTAINVCQRNIKQHLRSLNVYDATLNSEAQLIFARAGKTLGSELEERASLTLVNISIE